MMGLLNNYDGAVWRVKELAELLANPAARRHLVSDVVEYAVLAHQAGIVVIRGSAAEEPAEFSRIHRRAGARAPLRWTKSHDCPAGPRRRVRLRVLWREPMPSSDELRPTLADLGTWPIAAQDWFMEISARFARCSGAENCGRIANYAYDWTESTRRDRCTRRNSAFRRRFSTRTNPRPMSIRCGFPESALFVRGRTNHTHQVWMLDAITAYNELRASERLGYKARPCGVSGLAILPSGRSGMPRTPTMLFAINSATSPGPDLILEGDGDIWHIADVPKNGVRSFNYDPATDLFTGEKYEAIPLSFDIEELGAPRRNW